MLCGDQPTPPRTQPPFEVWVRNANITARPYSGLRQPPKRLWLRLPIRSRAVSDPSPESPHPASSNRPTQKGRPKCRDHDTARTRHAHHLGRSRSSTDLTHDEHTEADDGINSGRPVLHRVVRVDHLRFPGEMSQPSMHRVAPVFAAISFRATPAKPVPQPTSNTASLSIHHGGRQQPWSMGSRA